MLPTLWAAALALMLGILVPPLLPGLPGWVLAFIETGLFVGLYLLAARTLRPRTGIVALMKQSQWPFARALAGAWAGE